MPKLHLRIKSYQKWQENTSQTAKDSLRNNGGELTIVKKNAKGELVFRKSEHNGSFANLINTAFLDKTDKPVLTFLTNYFHQQAITCDLRILKMMTSPMGFATEQSVDNKMNFQVEYDQVEKQLIFSCNSKFAIQNNPDVIDVSQLPERLQVDESSAVSFESRMCIPIIENNLIPVPEVRIVDMTISVNNPIVLENFRQRLREKPKFKSTPPAKEAEKDYDELFSKKWLLIMHMQLEKHPIYKVLLFASLFSSVGLFSFVLLSIITATVIISTGGLGTIPIVGAWLLLHLGNVVGVTALSTAIAAIGTSVFTFAGAVFVATGEFMSWLLNANGKSEGFLSCCDPNETIRTPLSIPGPKNTECMYPQDSNGLESSDFLTDTEDSSDLDSPREYSPNYF